jgi:ligand-binding sensor domain-containing protein/serine phosphatase RsbU (regulator of sigma subunit)
VNVKHFFLLAFLFLSPAQAHAEVLARLSVEVPVGKLAAFGPVYHARFTPLLISHGWTPVDRHWPPPPSTYNVLYSFPTIEAAIAAWTKLSEDQAYLDLKSSLLGQFGMYERIRDSFEVCVIPAGPGKTRKAGSGQSVKAGRGAGNWRHFDVNDGVPSAVYRNGTIQDQSGSLWFGTQGEEMGVVRFDGNTWEVFTDEETPRANRFNRMIKDSRGAIWVASGGGGVARYADGEWTRFKEGDGLPGNWVGGMTEDRDGNLWFGTWWDGAARLSFTPSGQASWRTYTVEDGLASNVVHAILSASDGTLWFGTSEGVTRLDGDRWESYDSSNGLPDDSISFQTWEDKEGRVYFVTTNHHVVRFDGKVWKLFRNDLGELRHVIQDEAGVLWFVTQQGLGRHDGSEFTSYTIQDGLPTNNLRCAAFDASGGLWIGTAGGICRFDNGEFISFPEQGTGIARSVFIDRDDQVWFTMGGFVLRYDPHSLVTYSERDKLRDHYLFDVVKTADDALWMTTKTEGIVRFDGELLRHYGTRDGMPTNETTAMMVDRDDRIWIGTRDRGVVVFDGDSFTTYDTTDGLVGNVITCLFQDDGGKIWIGTREGFSRYDGHTFTNYGRRDGIRRHWVWNIQQTGPEDFWFVFEDSGIGRLRDGAFETFLPEGESSGTKFMSLLKAADGALWAGSKGRGLFRYREGTGWSRFTRENGLAGNTVSCLHQDTQGVIWIGCYNGGITRYDGETFQTLTMEDGLPHHAIEDFEDRDGEMWVTTIMGLTRIGIAEGRKPSARIDQVIADRQYSAPKTIRIPRTTSYVSIGFSGTSLKTRPGGVVFRYRLSGRDDDWRQTNKTEVAYVDLDSGDYMFEVQSVDRDHAYSDPIRLSLSVHPPYETYALWSALLVAIGLVVGQTTRVVRRDRELKQTQARLIDEMGKELEAARKMQMDLLPKETPRVNGLQFAGYCEPATQVGGDYYTYLEADGLAALVVADVSGKGMQAATIAMRFNEMLAYEYARQSSLTDVLMGLDHALRGRIPPEMFSTCGIAEFDGRHVTVASAACPEVFLYRASGGSTSALGLSGFPIGLPLVIEGQELFQETTVELLEGDVLVFTSDGVEEAFNPDDEMFGSERLCELVHQCGQRGLSAEGIRDEIVRAVAVFSNGRPQSDDLTVAVVKACD